MPEMVLTRRMEGGQEDETVCLWTVAAMAMVSVAVAVIVMAMVSVAVAVMVIVSRVAVLAVRAVLSRTSGGQTCLR